MTQIYLTESFAKCSRALWIDDINNVSKYVIWEYWYRSHDYWVHFFDKFFLHFRINKGFYATIKLQVDEVMNKCIGNNFLISLPIKINIVQSFANEAAWFRSRISAESQKETKIRFIIFCLEYLCFSHFI